MVKIFKFRLSKNKNSDDNDFEPNSLNSSNLGGFFKVIGTIWVIFLILNLLNLTNELKFQSQIFAVLWFFLSFLFIVFGYKFGFGGANLTRFIAVFVAFCAGFFASALYFGSIAQNAFEFGGICALLTLFFSFGFAVIL